MTMKRFRESPIARSLDMMGGVFGDFYRSLSIEDRKFVKEQISHFHNDVQKILIRKYQSFDKPFNANTYIRKMSDELNALLPEKIIPYFDAGENELRELAEENSQRCKRFEINSLNNSDTRNVTGNNPVNGNLAL
jgi:hypothetical protein